MGRRAWNALAGICLWGSAVRLAGAEPTNGPTAPVAPPPTATAPALPGPVSPSTSASPVPAPSAPNAGAAPAATPVGSGSPSATAPSTVQATPVPQTPSPSSGVPQSSAPAVGVRESGAPTSGAAEHPEPVNGAMPAASQPATTQPAASQPATTTPASELTWGAPPTASAALLEAESAVLDVDYDRSLKLAQQAISAGALTRDELRRAYLALALSAAQLDRPDVALPAFLKLFALDPEVEVGKRLAPARRSAAISAQQYWASHGQRLSLQVEFDREERQLVVRTVDPLSWVNTVEVWVRKPGTEYVQHTIAPGPAVRLPLEVEPLDELEVYAHGLDDRSNVVVERASTEEPLAFVPALDDTLHLERDIRSGETGSVAQRLANSAVATHGSGYASLELRPQADGNGAAFDMSHATLYWSSRLSRRVSLELGLDVAHLAQSHRDITLPHSFVDLALEEWLVVRPGFFEVPVGAFNEYLWPDFVRTTGAAPLFSTLVVPGLWSELGVQVRGRVPVFAGAYFTYAVFVSNGLEQADDSVGDGVVAEGGDLMAMRYNVRDEHSSDKAVGGRVGLSWGRLDVGASGYTGRYTIEANRRLSIADIDVSYRSRWFTFRAEGAASFQEVTGGRATKTGAYALVSSRVAPHLEPYLQYDFVNDRKAEQHRILFGNAVYPFPNELNARTLRLKTEVGVTSGAEPDAAFVWLTQLVSAF